MKKVLTSLMILFVFVGLVGCQKKITASICPEFTKIPYDYQYETVSQKIRKYGSRIKRAIKSFFRK